MSSLRELQGAGVSSEPLRSVDAGSSAAPGTGRRWRGASLLPILGVVLVLLASEAVSRFHVLPPREYPPISTVAQALFSEIQTHPFWNGVSNTLLGWAIGLAAGAALALPLGLLLGGSAFLYRSCRLVIEWLRPIPPVALIPIAVLLYGIGIETKVLLVAISAFWPILLQVIYGVRDVDPVALDCVRSYRLRLIARIRYLVLPSASPYIMTGLRVASSIALIVAIATELVIGAPGIGRLINAAQIGGEQPVQYAYIVTAGLLGWALNAIFVGLERRVLHWHPSQRAAASP